MTNLLVAIFMKYHLNYFPAKCLKLSAYELKKQQSFTEVQAQFRLNRRQTQLLSFPWRIIILNILTL